MCCVVRSMSSYPEVRVNGNNYNKLVANSSCSAIKFEVAQTLFEVHSIAVLPVTTL